MLHPILLAATLLSAPFEYVPAIYCQHFADCLAQLPPGPYAASTVFLADFADYAAMNREYEKRFTGLKPARNTIQVRLPAPHRFALNATRYTGPAPLKGLTPPNLHNPVPISPAVVAGTELFIAGILGRDSNSGTIPAAPADQIELCLTRLTKVLATAQLNPAHLVQATVYHTAAIPRDLLETRLKHYLGPHLTIAITILEVPALALGANLAINGIASFLHTGV